MYFVKVFVKLRAQTKYEYEATDQLCSRDTRWLIDSEAFQHDAAADRLNFTTSQFDKVKDNRSGNGGIRNIAMTCRAT